MLIHCIENPPADGLIHYCGCSIKVWYISVLKNFDGNFYPWKSISWTAQKNTLCYFILRILLNTKFFKVSAGSVSHTPALQATSVGLTRETYWNPKPETQITFCINLSPVAFSKQWNSQIFWHPGSVEPRPTQHTKKSWETLHVALGFLQVSSWIFCNGSTFHSSHLYLQKQVRNHWNHPESIELVHIVPTVYEIKLKCKSDTNYTYTHTLQTCTRVFISKHRNDSDLQDLSFPLRSWTKNNKIEDKHMFFEQWDTTKTVRKKSSRMRCRFNICKNHKISTEYTRTPTEVGILI